MLEPVARGRHRRSRIALIASAIVASAALVLTGCSAGTGSADTASTSGSGSFPVTIKSALGSATIEKAPTRVATWGWGAQDAALALGVVPVAMPKNTYGGNADGVLPWDADRIDELGGKTPALLSGTDTSEVPFEQFVAAKPDVILAPYSGLTQKDYDTLSKIAPVVAYPKDPWATSWQDQLSIVGKALGKSTEAAALQKKTDDEIAALAAKYPVLKDKSFVYISANEPGQVNVFRSTDPRVQLLEQLGMKDELERDSTPTPRPAATSSASAMRISTRSTRTCSSATSPTRARPTPSRPSRWSPRCRPSPTDASLRSWASRS